jgi:hypothetical protein
MAIPPQLIGMGLSTLASIPQWMTGSEQERRAEELSKGFVRPTYDTPESQKRALTSAEEQAKMTRLPSQSAIEGRLDQTTANTLAMLERLGTGGPTTINAASRAFGNQMEAENKLGIEAGNMYLRNQDVLRNELGKTAQYEDKAWNWNQMTPYVQKANTIEALKEGSMRNKNAAWNNIFGGAATFFNSGGDFGGQDMSWLSSILGGGNSMASPQGQPTSTPPPMSVQPPMGGKRPDLSWFGNYQPMPNAKSILDK